MRVRQRRCASNARVESAGMNVPKKQPVQTRKGSDKLPTIRSPPQPTEISSHTGVVRSVSAWIRMTKMDMEGGRSGESEYVHAEREQTKVQLHGITKRLCEVQYMYICTGFSNQTATALF